MRKKWVEEKCWCDKKCSQINKIKHENCKNERPLAK